MPDAPLHPCKHPGCSALTAERWCAQHQPRAAAAKIAQRVAVDARRGTARERGYDSRWADLSRLMRTRFPISPGYLTRTALWTPALAHHFHTLRVLAAERGEFAGFFAPNGAGQRYLEQFPIYDFHAGKGSEPSQVTDHIIPHRGDPSLFWQEWNLQAVSKRQHDEKTARFDGGFRGAGSQSLPKRETPHLPAAAGIL